MLTPQRHHKEVVPIGALYIAATVILTIYGQLAFKWRIDLFRASHEGLSVVATIVKLSFDPWVISTFAAAALAAVAWGAALARLELSFAYPFMALSFAGVTFFSVVLMDETLTPGKVIGLVLIGAGLVVTSL